MQLSLLIFLLLKYLWVIVTYVCDFPIATEKYSIVNPRKFKKDQIKIKSSIPCQRNTKEKQRNELNNFLGPDLDSAEGM